MAIIICYKGEGDVLLLYFAVYASLQDIVLATSRIGTHTHIFFNVYVKDKKWFRNYNNTKYKYPFT
jgi:hypothetical protein